MGIKGAFKLNGVFIVFIANQNINFTTKKGITS